MVTDRHLRIYKTDPHHAWSRDEVWAVAYDHEPSCDYIDAAFPEQQCRLPTGHDGIHTLCPSARVDLTGMRFTHCILEVDLVDD